MEIVSTRHVWQVPEEVGRCPDCRGKLTASASGWTQQDDGSWLPDKPDFEDESAWIEYEDSHGQGLGMPYVYWMPVTNRIEAWIAKHYRVSMDDLPF